MGKKFDGGADTLSMIFVYALAHGLVELPPDLLDAVNRMTVTDLMNVAARLANRGGVAIHANEHQLRQSLIAIQNRKAQDETIADFVRAGASSSMMLEIFRLSRGEVIMLRKELKVTVSKGRPQLPPEDVIPAIWRAWETIEKSLTKKDRYLALHKLFPTVPMASLYTTLAEGRKCAA